MRLTAALTLSILLLVSSVGSTTSALADTPTTVTSFAWGTATPLGDTAARLTINLLEPSHCSWHFNMAGSQAPRGGPFMFMSLANTTEDRFSGTRVSSYKNTHAHVFDLADARSPVRVEGVATVFPTGTWAGRGWTNSTTTPFGADVYDYSLGGLLLAPTKSEPGLTGSYSLFMSVTCDRPFEVLGYSGSHEVMLWSDANTQGGIGAFESLAVAAEIGDHIEMDFTTPLVQNELWFKRYNEVGHVGTLTRTTPSGVTTWNLLEETEVTIDDATGPGLHRYDLDRVGLDFFSTMGGVSYGLTPIAEFDALIEAAGARDTMAY